jgi:hypothetical protein
MLLIIQSFWQRKEKSESFAERSLLTSAALDILLFGGCSALLFIVEAQRCSDKELYGVDADRYLASETTLDGAEDYDASYGGAYGG